MSLSRDRILTEARRWIATPYHHQASLIGIGADCLGFVSGVYENVMGTKPAAAPAYSPGWAEARGIEPLYNGAQAHLVERADLGFEPGDVLLFRLRPHLQMKHMAIASGPDTMIHAYDSASVAETSIGPWWRRRLAAVFAFPGVALGGPLSGKSAS